MANRLALVFALIALPVLVAAQPAEWKRVLAKQPHDPIAFAELVAASRSAGTYERLVAEYRAMPGDWATLVVLGRLEQNAGRMGDAVARWNAAVALRDDDAATWTLLGGVHRFNGDIAKARAAYDKAVA